MRMLNLLFYESLLKDQPTVTKRTNHYEAAFEAFLRERGIPYIAVDDESGP